MTKDEALALAGAPERWGNIPVRIEQVMTVLVASVRELKAKLAEAEATIDNLAHQATHVTCRMERDRLQHRWDMLTSWIRSNPEPTLSRLDAHHLVEKLEADHGE